MLHGTIRNDDFKRNTALQHCYFIVSNGCNIVKIKGGPGEHSIVIIRNPFTGLGHVIQQAVCLPFASIDCNRKTFTGPIITSVSGLADGF